MLRQQINSGEKSKRELEQYDSKFEKVELEVDENTDALNENYIYYMCYVNKPTSLQIKNHQGYMKFNILIPKNIKPL